MTTYVSIASTQTDPYAPLDSPLMKALAENPTAITEGASGAPRIDDAALGSTATNTGRDWILARLALMATNTVGSLAFAATQNSPTAVNFGSTIAGSSLVPVGFQNGAPVDNGGALSGTWMALGYKPARATNTPGNLESTLFIRVS